MLYSIENFLTKAEKALEKREYPREIVSEYSYLEFYGRLSNTDKLKLMSVINESDESQQLQGMYVQLRRMYKKELKDKTFVPPDHINIMRMLSAYLSEKLSEFKELSHVMNVGKKNMVCQISHDDMGITGTSLLISIWAYATDFLAEFDYWINGKLVRFIYHDIAVLQHLQNNEVILKKSGIRISSQDYITFIACTDITKENNPELYDLIQYSFENYIEPDFDSVLSKAKADMTKSRISMHNRW